MSAQNQENSDTIFVSEIDIKAQFELENKDVLNFYRSNYFSTIDNINSRLDGLSLIKRGAYAAEPQINGFSGGQLNVTIDGMRMFGACTDKMDPVTSYIEPTNLKSITVNQGTNGCATGCNIGGSLDMSLQEPESKTSKAFNGNVGFGFESISMSRNLLFSSNYQKKKWLFGLNGVYRKNEAYRAGNGEKIPFSYFEKGNLHAVVKYLKDEKNSFKLDFLYDLAKNVGYPALPMDVGTAKAILVAGEYKKEGKTSFKGKIYFNRIFHLMDDSKRDSLYFVKNHATGRLDSVYMRMDMPGSSNTLGMYAQITRNWAEKHRLTVKIDNYTNVSLAEMTMFMRYPSKKPEAPMYMQTWPEMLRNVTGLYFQNTSFFTSKFSLNLNARVDFNTDILRSEYGERQFSVFGYTLPKKQESTVRSLNISAEYQLTDKLNILLSGGYAERMPVIGERFGFYLYNAYDGFDYIGTPDLKVEKGKNLRFSAQYTSEKLKFSFSQSANFVKDYILGITDSTIPPMNFYARGTRRYQNIESAEIHASDFSFFYFPSKSVTVFSVTKFTYGKINNATALPLIPPLKNFLAVKFEKKNFFAQVECENALAQNRINAEYGEKKTPSFTVFHLKTGCTLHFSEKQVFLGFNISNLSNRTYYEHLDWGKIYRPGRNFEIFCQFTW